MTDMFLEKQMASNMSRVSSVLFMLTKTRMNHGLFTYEIGKNFFPLFDNVWFW